MASKEEREHSAAHSLERENLLRLREEKLLLAAPKKHTEKEHTVFGSHMYVGYG